MIARREVLGPGVVIGLGLVVGALSAVESRLPLAAVAAAILLFTSLKRPAIPIAMAFAALLLDAHGVTSLKVAGLPITFSKLTIAYAFAAHGLHALVTRQPLLHRMPTTWAMIVVLLGMLLSLANSFSPAAGYAETAGILMLVAMSHLIYTAVKPEQVTPMMRFMGVVTLLVLLWTLIGQRGSGMFATVSQAWGQRTAGGFGDPNAWATCVLVVSPMILAFLMHDDHPLATPLMAALGAAFPAAIVQSMSRAGLVAFVIIVPGLVWMLWPRRRVFYVSFVGAVVALPFLIPVEAVLVRYQTLLNPALESNLGHGSLSERAALLDAGLQMFVAHPATGVGVGMFKMFASHVSPGQVWKIAHNSYVNVAAEQGIPGLLAHGFLAVQMTRAVVAVWRRSDDARMRTLGFGALLSLVAFGAMAATLNLATFAIAWYMMAFALAVGRHHGAEAVVDPLDAANQALASSPRPSRIAA